MVEYNKNPYDLSSSITVEELHEQWLKQAAENGWSRNVLVHQIESGLYQRQVLVEKVSNFDNRLPRRKANLPLGR